MLVSLFRSNRPVVLLAVPVLVPTGGGPRPIGQIALANAQTPMPALFGVGAALKVPAYAVFAENDTAALIAETRRP